MFFPFIQYSNKMLLTPNYNPAPKDLLFGYRVYAFSGPRDAEQFADLFGGFARSGKTNGQWLAFI